MSETDEVSLNGSPTVSPITAASWSGEFFSFKSTSTTFLALSHEPPAFAIYIAWNKPNTAIETRYATKKFGSKNANANVIDIRAIKIFHIPFCANWVQIFTTAIESSVFASCLSKLKVFFINSTAEYAPVVTACIDAPLNQ